MKRLFFLVALGLGFLLTQSARGDTFGSGENTFEIEFVTIGDPGNAPDTVVPVPTSAPLPSGTVNYAYRMAKYEISEVIIAKANIASGLSGNPLDLAVDVERGPHKPATGLSWFDAVRFVNWLNEEQGSPVAYKFSEDDQFQLWEPGDPGYNAENPLRNTQARYFLPSADEWHKAAYYDPVNDRYWLYPFGSDDPPVAVASGVDPGTAVFNQSGPADVQLAGGENLFGLMGMAGNAYEFEESTVELTIEQTTTRGVNGGAWILDLTPSLSSAFRNMGFAAANQPLVGIRIASIPEPSTLTLLLIGLFATAGYGGRS